MAKIPIKIGNFYTSYIYILGACLFRFLEDYIIEFKDLPGTKRNIFGIETAFRDHKIIISLYSNIGNIIFGLIFFYISNKNKRNRNKISDNRTSKAKKPLIYKKFFSVKNSLKNLLIVGFLFSLDFLLRKIVWFFSLGDFDLWIFNIIFILLYMKHYYVVNLYRHQKFSLMFIFSTNFIFLISFTFLKTHFSMNINDKITPYQYVAELFGSSAYTIIIFIFYIILSNILSIARVLSKKLMEIEYETPYRIIFFIGVIGSLLFSITLIITSNFKCSERINKTACYDYYLDSIPAYFSDLKKQNAGIFFVDLLIVLPSFLFVSFFQFACQMLIIFHLNPNYILISDCLYYAIKQIIGKINGKLDTKMFIMQFTAEICALLGYLVFLEIIVLNCFKLNKDIKSNIIERGLRDSTFLETDMNLFAEGEKEDSDDENDDLENEKESKNIEMVLQ